MSSSHLRTGLKGAPLTSGWAPRAHLHVVLPSRGVASAAQAGSRVTPHLASIRKAGVPGAQEIHVSVCGGFLTGDKAFVEIIKTSVKGP